jgi:hypothetical protein
MYTINIRIKVDAVVFPYQLRNTELVELVVESAVGCALQNLFATVDIKDISMSPASEDEEVERDWDALLSQDF